MRPALLALALLATACREPVLEDELLARGLDVAEKSWDGVLLEFGSPRALPHLSENGWSQSETAPDGNTFRWVDAQTASFTFESVSDGRRIAWLECEPYLFDGSPTQWIALAVNGEDVTEVELRPSRTSYPIELPFVVGTNTVEMRFRYAGDPNRGSADRRELAAAFYRFDLPPPNDAPVAGRTGPFARVDERLHLPAGGRVTVYADIADRARLEVSPSGRGLLVRVFTEDRELVNEVVDAAWEYELDVNGTVAIALEAREPMLVRAALNAPRASPTPAPARERPRGDANIVLVFLDGANALRMSPTTTPVLDELASRSIVFERAVSQAVYTIASIGSVLTGQYPERHQSVSFADKLRADVVTFPALLSESGYRTAGFSGNAVASKTFGLHQGYEEFFQIWERDDYTGHGDSVLGAFRDWLANAGDDRFFAYVHFREPHFPYDPPPPFDTQFGEGDLFPDGMADWPTVEAMNARAESGEPPPDEVLDRVRSLYRGNFAYVDDLVGQLLECLEDREVEDETIVIVTADHGEALFEHGYIGHNTQLYEESVRVPLIVKLPGTGPRRVDDVVELIDLAPTILELAGTPVPDTMQGKSLFDPNADRLAFTRTVWVRARYSVRSESHKLIWDSRTGETELYDLAADAGETQNIYGDDAFVSGYLEQRLFAWLRAQELLRGVAGVAEISQEQLRILEALGYANQMSPRPERER